MTLEQLAYLVQIIDCGSITAAAAKMHLSQPNLSTSLKALEDEVGCSLLIRARSGVTPTKDGQRAYQLAAQILERTEQIRALGSPPPDARVELHIGSISGFNALILPQCIVRFGKQFPYVNIVIHTGGSGAILQDLCERRIDLGIIAEGDVYVPPPDLTAAPLCRSSSVLYIASELANRLTGPLCAQDVAGIPLLCHQQDGSSMYQQVLDYFFGTDAAPEPALVSADLSLIKSLVVNGQGYALLHTLVLQDDSDLAAGRTAAFPLQNVPGCTIYAVRRRQRIYPPSTLAFMEELKRTAARFSRQQEPPNTAPVQE